MRERLRSPFRKLKNFALSKQGIKETKGAPDAIDEEPLPSVVKCMQDATDLRLKYEGLLTNGQIISGAAYDFSRSLQDMASYMIESFGEVADLDIGNIFSMLAKVQFEMSKLLDLFAGHVSKTIIKPTEMLMTKIQQAEIMKDQYDDERKLYILSLMKKKAAKEKRGNASMGQRENLVDEKSIQAKANLLTVYMESLTRGQSENLVNQAVKYHSAHMHLFSKGFASINAVEPMIRQVALDRLIDTTFSEEAESINDFMNSSEMNPEAKVHNYHSRSDSAASSLRHLVVNQTASPCCLSDSSEEGYSKRSAFTSKSAPVSPLTYHRREVKENVQESSLDNEHESVTMYALPSPLNECGGKAGDKTSTRCEKHLGVVSIGLEKIPGEILEAFEVEHKSDMSVVQYSNPLRQQNHFNTKSENLAKCTDDDGLCKPIAEKDKRYTQSGPLVDSPSYKHMFANMRSSRPMALYDEHIPGLFKSVPVGLNPYFSYTSGNISPPSSSAISISELHPLPPLGSKTPSKSPNHTPNPITHSAPLGKVKRYAGIR